MKKYKIARILILGVLMISVILTACSQNTVETNQAKTESTTVTTTVAAESTTENTTEKETAKSESTAKKISNSDTTTKPAEQKSAGQTTTEKQSETNAKKDYTQTTTGQNAETTKVAATTKKETTTKKQTTTEKPFDINYWVSYAKDYARSVGLEVNSSASDCWDNPISANSKCVNLKRDIQSRINRYSKDEDITQIWVWAEKTSADSYNIYIGYA